MKRKYGIITLQIERHWVILTAVVIIVGLLYFGVSYSDQSNCSKKNPTIDCSVTGTIDISVLQTSGNWTQTTGFGSHWAVNSQGAFVPQPEYRSGYYHAICLGYPTNSTCNWHIDKYPATQDLPFGPILHLSDYLTLNTPIASEDFWQIALWIAIVLSITGSVEGIARLAERYI